MHDPNKTKRMLGDTKEDLIKVSELIKESGT